MMPRRSSKRAKTKTKSLVNWLDLPRDVTIQIFIKIGTIELLYNAQRVCSSWRAIAKDPQLYRSVDLRDPWKWFDEDSKSFEAAVKMARLAIDRGLGQAVEFSIDSFCTDGVLYHLINKAPLLKCLRITNGNDIDKCCVVEVIQKLPELEELEFSFSWFCCCSVDLIEGVGFSCRMLKSFALNGLPEKLSHGEATEYELNEKAFAVADNLNPGLKSLSLMGNSMNNDGLEVVLERFTQLEYLDLRQCANLDLVGDLLKKCQGIKTLKLPNDSTDDYPLGVGDNGLYRSARLSRRREEYRRPRDPPTFGNRDCVDRFAFHHSEMTSAARDCLWYGRQAVIDRDITIDALTEDLARQRLQTGIAVDEARLMRAERDAAIDEVWLMRVERDDVRREVEWLSDAAILRDFASDLEADSYRGAYEGVMQYCADAGVAIPDYLHYQPL